MKHIASILLLFISMNSHAEIRGVDIGDSCEKIWKLEERLGSFISKEKIEGKKLYEGIAYGKTSQIIYICEEGRIQSQQIILVLEKFDTAKSRLIKARNDLERKYGKYIAIEEEVINMFQKRGFSREFAIYVWGYYWGLTKERVIQLRLIPNERGLYQLVVSHYRKR